MRSASACCPRAAQAAPRGWSRATSSPTSPGTGTLPLIGELHLSSTLLFDLGVYLLVVGATILMLVALAHQSLRSHRQQVETSTTRVLARARTRLRAVRLMELILTLGIGVLTASGVWLLLRPRTFQVIMGLSLLSYAVNLFIFCMGRLVVDAPPVITGDGPVDASQYADPVPQALVLTAIVIGFATTALFLVVILAARGMTGTDHVDGQERDS